jgi:uncharacterized protein (TIGR03435 family)
MELMLRSLLAERFKLTVHPETRDLPIYALVMARSDGKVGPDLHKTEADCAAALAARGNASPIPGGPFCGIRNGPGRLILSSVPMPVLATTLSRSVSRTVVDQTGLTGTSTRAAAKPIAAQIAESSTNSTWSVVSSPPWG